MSMKATGAEKKHFVVVGVGARSAMFTEAITEKFTADCQLVGFCDTNPGRLELARTRLPAGYPEVSLYAAADFENMLAEKEPHAVIVTPPDRYHDEYIIAALEAGCDAITEKPMTTTPSKCQAIVDAVSQTSRNVRVTFNYRYSPARSQVKELLMEGVIGKVLSVDFNWLLNTRHGADYYRRWHRNKVNSGGLMVHKATHHFDLVNWWISSIPAEVHAMGKRSFYRPETAERLGLGERGERCRGCPVSGECSFFLDLASRENLKALYLDHEQHDGYLRDRCVFSDEIDIEDTMNVAVRYRNGVMLSYSLNSFMPWEGYTVAFNGTKGRLEHRTVETVYISGDGTTPGETVHGETCIRLYPHFQAMQEIPIRKATGGHGGGDDPMLEDIFAANRPTDPLMRAAGYVEGAYSILTGAAANISMAEDRPVLVDSLVKGIPEPRFTSMPA